MRFVKLKFLPWNCSYQMKVVNVSFLVFAGVQWLKDHLRERLVIILMPFYSLQTWNACIFLKLLHINDFFLHESKCILIGSLCKNLPCCGSLLHCVHFECNCTKQVFTQYFTTMIYQVVCQCPMRVLFTENPGSYTKNHVKS